MMDGPPTSGVYLDSSAVAKLVLREPEREALGRYVAGHSRRIVSEVALGEVPRAVRRSVQRRGGSVERALAALDRVLRGLDLVTLDRPLLVFAGRLEPSSLRTLDAIHVASALTAPGQDGVFISYDRRQLEAARGAGLTVAVPGAR